MLARLLRLIRSKAAPEPTRRGPAPLSERRSQPAPFGAASGPVIVSYAPRRDGRPDPGEVVWTSVTFEDAPNQSKDRPVLIIGRRGAWLAALLLTSKSHGSGPGRAYMDVGTGPWDPKRRPGQVRLDRLLDVDPAHVRREGAALDPELFSRVLEAARPYLPELRS